MFWFLHLSSVIEYNYIATSYKYICVVAAEHVEVLNVVEADTFSCN